MGWVLFLASGVGLWLHWGDLEVWLLMGAALLALQRSRGFSRPDVEPTQKEPPSAEKVLRWYPKWW